MIHDINQIIELALKNNASDIHLVCGLPVKCRVDGRIVNLCEDIVELEDCEIIARELLKEKCETVGFLIGPEGGLSEKETALAKENGIALAGLGKRILRTETASGYVLSAISVLLEN